MLFRAAHRALRTAAPRGLSCLVVADAPGAMTGATLSAIAAAAQLRLPVTVLLAVRVPALLALLTSPHLTAA